MASKTAQVERIRERKRYTNGKARKNKLRLHGTTRPSLPLDKPNANERAQLALRTPAQKA